MKKIKVKSIFGAHQIYQEIANYPPKNVEYVGLSKETIKGRYYENKKWKERINRWTQKLNIPRMIIVKPGKYDLIHSSRGIIPLNRKNWVMDIEQVCSFMGSHPKAVENKYIKKFIENRLASKNCKKILCHCKAAHQGFLNYLDCTQFKHKFDILYPASHIIPIKKEKHKKVRILCILSLFRHKAGSQVLKVFTELEKKYKNIELWMRADVPLDIKKKYNSKNIKYMEYFGEILPREELIKKIYSRCDIFVYPTFCDSFGYSLIDAMVAGLPIVSTNLFAVPEIVEDGKSGFIVKIPGYDLKKAYRQSFPWEELKGKKEEIFISEIKLKLEKLINDKKLREKMGREGFKQVNNGKFSINERNKKLRMVYGEAIK